MNDYLDRYVIYHEFGKRYLTSEQNYTAYIRNASIIIDISKFDSDDAAVQYLIDNWKIGKSQVRVLRKDR